ncbi:C-type lectin domain-containing protein 141-like isoform X1 [Neocloeon triangulifer]|uniref:C-type lectin domain-containing protein 141-like isoform X1 n=1 Tax=Neocloeon triangulifer TaxID=2078957 RepID=UPI00286F4407|nr:C-type lectin domain-containing protein 141-like isoform X1 [Neocloeon triangulifer]
MFLTPPFSIKSSRGHLENSFSNKPAQNDETRGAHLCCPAVCLCASQRPGKIGANHTDVFGRHDDDDDDTTTSTTTSTTPSSVSVSTLKTAQKVGASVKTTKAPNTTKTSKTTTTKSPKTTKASKIG